MRVSPTTVIAAGETLQQLYPVGEGYHEVEYGGARYQVFLGIYQPAAGGDVIVMPGWTIQYPYVTGEIDETRGNVPSDPVERSATLRRFNLDEATQIQTYKLDPLKIGGVAVGGALGVVAATSCPVVAIVDGDRHVVVGEAYPGAIFRSLQRDDLLPLPSLPGGRLTLRVRNDNPEVQYTDSASLLVVEHSTEQRALATHDGRAILVGAAAAFDAAMSAAARSKEAGLTVAFSVCPTRDFATREHLERYAALAARAGASFIQIMERRQVGHYAGRDVLLGPSELQALESFSDWMNFADVNAAAPIVTYPALYQRRYGCFGAAERYLYIDTNGEAHACPFCRHAAANVLRDGVNTAIDALQARGCPAAAAAPRLAGTASAVGAACATGGIDSTVLVATDA